MLPLLQYNFSLMLKIDPTFRTRIKSFMLTLGLTKWLYMHYKLTFKPHIKKSEFCHCSQKDHLWRFYQLRVYLFVSLTFLSTQQNSYFHKSVRFKQILLLHFPTQCSLYCSTSSSSSSSSISSSIIISTIRPIENYYRYYKTQSFHNFEDLPKLLIGWHFKVLFNPVWARPLDAFFSDYFVMFQRVMF
jgi:hypothetical protein